MLAASFLRLPCFLHEQNVFPGLATRLLSRLAKATFVSFSATCTYPKGNLRHTEILFARTFARHMPKKGDEFAVFVFGGSRGARSINEAVLLCSPVSRATRTR
jgi:UDP-N-acetylglucosamine--N-acetylmuramyl-(pentapeptide) pyrophosphoryl-undecaprenol N-acetylglucosamine transferase